MRLKPVNEQVVVLTGATSGIGLATARLFAEQGAKLVLVARDAAALDELAGELRAAGADALPAPADVGDEAAVHAVAAAAVARYGRFDTWVNDAGTSVYGDMIDIPTDDFRRVVDTNFWGVVYGSVAAARHFRTRPADGPAGVIINVGSGLGDRAIPKLGMYCATKYAVKGFTEALRMELEAAGVPAVVTLVKPSSIDTPFPQHARNYMSEEPTLPPPVYTPGVVARAILHCAATPERDVPVGAGTPLLAAANQVAPRLTDKLMARTVPAQLKKGEPPRDPRGAFYAPKPGPLRERGDYHGPALPASPYTAAVTHPVLTAALAVGAGLAAVALLSASGKRSS